MFCYFALYISDLLRDYFLILYSHKMQKHAKCVFLGLNLILDLKFYPSNVGRTTKSDTSTLSGCEIAYKTALAIVSGCKPNFS